MENFEQPETNLGNQEVLEKKFNYYMKDFPLSEEELQKPLLDVGTGKGGFIKYLREVLGNNEAVGVDYSSSKIDPTYKGLLVADGTSLPFSEESFDTVTAHNYLPMFVSNPEKMRSAINELLRVVKKDGRVMGDIATPEGVIESNEDVRSSLGDDYEERDEELFRERLEGSQELQKFLDEFDQNLYEVEFSRKGSKSVVIIKKK